jgi:hypothetical protein
MATYTFETPVDMVDEVLNIMSPRELANYLYHNHPAYTKDLQWDIETYELDNEFGDFNTFEEFAAGQGQQSFSFS